MKIGILTLPLHTNYGGILQAYALQTTLERMGHQVILLNKSQAQKLPLSKMLFIYSKRIIKKYILHKKCRVFAEHYYNKIFPIICQYTQQFIDRHIHYITFSKLSSNNIYNFDVIIVGSDQIWRPTYYPNMEDPFLAFTKGWKIKRIGYAVSFGTDKWEYTQEQTNKCKKLVQSFDAISVRESSGINLCKRYYNITAEHVLDPTLLLNRNDYINLFKKTYTPTSSGNMLIYILDESPEKTKLIYTISNKKKLTPFRVNSLVENINAPLEQRIQPPVEQWLRGFYDAEFVITDSFHACVFSILFHKPFIVYGNKERGLARFMSLLNLFSLNDRIITNNNISDKLLYSEIDWNIIEEKLKELQEKSLNFLLHNINANRKPQQII